MMARWRWQNCVRKAAEPSRKRRRPQSFGECLANWSGLPEQPGRCLCPGLRKDCRNWCRNMPLIRKPEEGRRVDERPDPRKTFEALSDADPDHRWRAARDAATLEGGDAALAAAL